MRLRPYLTLLRHNPAFTRLFSAQLISFAGDWFATVALLGLALEFLFAARGLGVLLGPFLVRSIVGLSERGLIAGIAVSFGIFGAAAAALGWIAFARPVWRRAPG